MRCTPMTVDLGPGPSVPALIRRVAGWDGLVCLYGAWADGGAVLASHPIRVARSDAALLELLEEQPSVSGGDGRVCGGWFGNLAFDGPSRLAFHDHVLRLVDGRWRFEALAHPDREDALAERLAAWRAVLEASEGGEAAECEVGEFSGRPLADHLSAVERAVELIRAGELYQVNVCTRLTAAFRGSAAALFADAVDELHPRYGALIGGPSEIVSLSPELFVQRRGRDVLSAPIKGTLPRGTADDNADALRSSVKDAAENVMIVDLVRNDLGRVAEIGTVRPAGLLEIEAHPGVWHLVSRVAARLRSEATDADLLAATFPPGSVTGAPKLRALAAIADLEPVGRRAYTGAIGFVSPTWGAQFSVAIRTFEIADGRIELGVGGGITADSVPMLEWRECLHKAAPLVAAARSRVVSHLGIPEIAPDPALLAGGLLETILGLDGEPVRLADHLARLDRSARELYRVALPSETAERVAEAAKSVPTGRCVLRARFRPGDGVDVTAVSASDLPGPLAARTMVRPSGLWRHKWADRLWAAESPSALFLGNDGSVLETVRGNIFLIDSDGTLVTPPLRDDLLPGVTRRALLDLARDDRRPTALRTFGVRELISRPAFWTSSLSGAVPIHSVDGIELPRADDLIATFREQLIGGAETVR